MERGHVTTLPPYHLPTSPPYRSSQALSLQSTPSHDAARIRLGQQVPLLPRLVGAGPAEHRIGEILSELHPGLIERIDAVQHAGMDRRRLEEHEEGSDVPGVHSVETEGHVGSPAPRQSAGGCPFLDREQLSQAVAAEIRQ